MTSIVASLATPLGFETPWLSLEAAELRVRVVTVPDAGSVPFTIQVQRVIEFYSQST